MNTITSIAIEFARIIRQELGGYAAIADAKNALSYHNGDFDTCATHDYIDANEVMAEAFKAVVGHEPEVTNQEDCYLFNTAWRRAKEGGFMHDWVESGRNALGASTCG